MTLATSSHASPGDARSLVMGSPQVGDPAPDFDERDRSGRSLSLLAFRGSPVVLAFSPTRWDPAASEHIENYNRLIVR